MSKQLKLGLATGYWASGPPAGIEDSIAEAERLGFDSIWTAEAYGSDCLTPLAWWGARTSRLKLGTSIAQISARTPSAMAMAAITLDHLSGGRFILGLGASGPQVVEGWYGQPYPRPLERTREYVDIIRRIVARDAPLEFSGRHYQVPFAGGTGLGKPLKSIVHPLRRDIPIYLGAEGPKNVAMTAEIADGWMPVFFSPKSDPYYRAALAEGFARPTARCTPDDFEVAAAVSIIVNDDVEAAADMMRPMVALYVGGMGAREANFHYDVVARLGYEGECRQIQQLYLEGKRREAMAAVPTRLIEDIAIIGPAGKVKDRLAEWQTTAATTLLVGGPPPTLRTIAALVNK
ncbi:MAG: LLM class F420-dependent oxidoreductase [Dehalococcoidia bacterium]